MARDRVTKRTYQVSKIINAPLKFVYDCCTGYREDDSNIIASKSKIIVLEKTKQQVVYTIRYKRRDHVGHNKHCHSQ